MYQGKAWCHQEIMKKWISTEWANPFKNPIGLNVDTKILIADSVKQLLKKASCIEMYRPMGLFSGLSGILISVDMN